jgi:hypothetical protein
LALVALSGCGSSRYTVLEPAKGPLTEYDILEFHDFTSNLNDVARVFILREDAGTNTLEYLSRI